MYLAVDLLTNRPFLDILSFSCHISLRSELLFNNLTKRLFINSYTSRNQLYTILPPHQMIFHQFVHLTKSFVYHSTTSPNDFHQLVHLTKSYNSDPPPWRINVGIPLQLMKIKPQRRPKVEKRRKSSIETFGKKKRSKPTIDQQMETEARNAKKSGGKKK